MTVAAEKRLDLSRLSRRVASVSPSATLAIDAKAKAMKQQGIDVVGFGAGEPDFPTPEHIVEAAVAACRDPRNHRYTPTAGLPELRAAIAEKTARDSLLDVTPEQVLVTNGGKQAVAQAFDALCDPGDEVIVSAPYWTTYPEAIRLAGASRNRHGRDDELFSDDRAGGAGGHRADKDPTLCISVEPDRCRSGPCVHGSPREAGT